jgi:pimeloyl-ACP methyl ester carboxylesterase
MRRSVSTVTLEGGMSLSYASVGESSGPAVLLLPGPTDSWRSYQPVLDRVPASLHVIAVSQRGHGDSDKPAAGYRVEDFAEDVPLVLDGLDVERAVLVGHSGSCLVARRAALDHPERVAGLVLEASPTSLRADPGLASFVTSVVADLEDPIDAEFARAVVADTSSDELPAALMDELTAELLKVPARVWREMFDGLLAYDDLAELGNVTVPTLLIWGDADPLVSRDMQHTLNETIPDTERLVYPGVGHTPRWEEPTRFTHDVANFVDAVTMGAA